MDIDNLTTFLIVARQGSMAAAARDLGLTANAVALRLRALEQEFGAPLVARAGRRVVPTEAGHRVLERLPDLLAGIGALKAAVHSDEIAGELRVGAIATTLTGLFPPLLERLTARYPRLKLHLEPGSSAELYARVDKGLLDMAAIVAPEFEMPKSLQFMGLRREPLILMAKWAETRTDPCAILRTEPVIVYDRRQWGGRLAWNWLKQTGIALRTDYELDALDAIAVMVDRGLGVAVVPDWAGPRPEGLRLTILDLPDPVPARVIGLLRAQSGPKQRLVAALSAIAAEIWPG